MAGIPIDAYISEYKNHVIALCIVHESKLHLCDCLLSIQIEVSNEYDNRISTLPLIQSLCSIIYGIL